MLGRVTKHVFLLICPARHLQSCPFITVMRTHLKVPAKSSPGLLFLSRGKAADCCCFSFSSFPLLRKSRAGHLRDPRTLCIVFCFEISNLPPHCVAHRKEEKQPYSGDSSVYGCCFSSFLWATPIHWRVTTVWLLLFFFFSVGYTMRREIRNFEREDNT